MSKLKQTFATVTILSVLIGGALPGGVSALTSAELQAQIDALMAQLNTLQGQLPVGTPSGSGAPAACSGVSLSRNLTVGSSGTDVKCLQALLNQSADTQVVASGVGSAGSETLYFGNLTRAAVKKFQEKYRSEVLAPSGLTAGTGFVGSATRAKLTSMLSVAVAPAPAPTPTPTPAPTPAPATTGAYSVALAADNPGAGTLGSASAYNTLLKATVNGGSAGISVTSVTVERFGLSVDTNVAGVLVVDAAGNRHGNVVTLADNKVTIPFASDPIVVAANSSTTISVQTNQAAGATSGTLGMKITAMNGDPAGLPLVGNLMTMTSSANIMGAVTVDVVSQTTATVNVDIGQTDYILTKFRFVESTGVEEVKISRLTLFQNGTAADADLTNFDLVDPNGNVLATVAKAVNKVIAFNLATPYTLGKGVQRDLTVRVDAVSGSSRTGQVIIQNDYDVQVMGASTGLGILVTAAGTVDTGLPIGDITTGNAGFNHLTIAEGTLTINKAVASPSGTYGIGQASITLATWELEAKGEDIQIQRAAIEIEGTADNQGNVDHGYTGTVKLMTDAGQILYSVAATTAALFDGDDDQVTLSTYYTIPASTKLKLKLVADASTAVDNSETSIGALSTVYFKRMTSNTFATAANGFANRVQGNTLTASSVTLTVSNNAALGNATVIEGGSEVLIGSFLLQTSSAEGVNVSSINVDITGAGVNTATPAVALSNLKLKRADTGAQIGTTTATPQAANPSSNTFTVSGQLNIPASTTVQVDVYVNMSTSASNGGTDDTVVTDLDAADVSGTGATSGSTVTGPAAGVTSRTITVVEGGTLSAAIDTSGAASSQFYTAGLTGLEMARIRLSATVENMKIDRFELRSVNGTGNIANVKLLGTGLSSDPATAMTAGTAVFTFTSGNELTVPAYGSRVVTAVVETAGAGTLVAGNLGILGFGTMNATGAGSGLVVQESLTGTTYTVANSAQFTGGTPAEAVGDVIYFTQTAAAGTNTAPGFYMVTAINNTNLTTAGSLALNSGATGTSFTAGDVVTRLTRAETIAGNGGNTTTTWSVGDLIYVRDNTGGTTGSGFAIVTAAVASGTNITGLTFSPAIGDISTVTAVATNQFTRLTNSNGMVGSTMRYEEVEPVITLASTSPSGTKAPGGDQEIAVFNVKASGARNMTFDSFTIEKSGSNSPDVNVTDFSLYDGSTRIARVANTSVAGSTAGAITNADTTLQLCSGTSDTAGEIGDITQAEADTLKIGDRVSIIDGTNTNTVTITANSGGTIAACNTNPVTNLVTFDGTVTIAASATVTFRNNRVHFDANQANTNDVALAEQSITAGQTTALTVRANTNSVRTGAGTASVTFGVLIPGVSGPLQVAATQVEGLNWDYTPLNTTSPSAAIYKTEADGYPVNGNTLTY